MLRMQQSGESITEIADWYKVTRRRVYEGIARCKKLAKAQRAG
jgi:predicted DNA-binding protein YlxM (UPF0122 family)